MTHGRNIMLRNIVILVLIFELADRHLFTWWHFIECAAIVSVITFYFGKQIISWFWDNLTVQGIHWAFVLFSSFRRRILVYGRYTVVLLLLVWGRSKTHFCGINLTWGIFVIKVTVRNELTLGPFQRSTSSHAILKLSVLALHAAIILRSRIYVNSCRSLKVSHSHILTHRLQVGISLPLRASLRMTLVSNDLWWLVIRVQLLLLTRVLLFYIYRILPQLLLHRFLSRVLVI